MSVRTTPVIIEAAVNGATPKHRNPHVPRTPAEISADIDACLDAGAAIVHNHNDEPNAGGAYRHASEPYAEAWAPVLARRPRALLYPTMAGDACGATVQDRSAHLDELHEAGMLPMGICDPGTISLGFAAPDGRPVDTGLVYSTTTADARWLFAWHAERGLPLTVSVFEPGFLRVALAHHRSGTLPAGSKLQLYFGGPGVLFGLPPTPTALAAYLELLDGTGLHWMVGVMGGDVIESGLAALAVRHGGHLRVGLEDFGGTGTPRNVELVRAAVEVVRSEGGEVATSEQASDVLFKFLKFKNINASVA